MQSTNSVRYNIDTVIQARETVKILLNKEILFLEKEVRQETKDLTKEKIAEEEFLDCLLPSVQDEFLAVFTRENKTAVSVRFINGQTFRIKVENVKGVGI